MSLDRATLPRDPDRLIEIVMELQDHNAHLQGIVATLTRALYGPRSEKLAVDTAQLPLELDDVVISEAPAAANDDDGDTELPSRSPRSRPKAARNIGALPKHLPRFEVVIDPESTVCPCCGGTLHMIGEDVSEQLDVIPAVLQVKRIRRPRYGCRSCEGAVVQAKAPPRLVENGMATTALVTSIVVAKFAWHLPLNRQTHMFRGHGIELDRSTLVHWVIRAAWWLRPLYTLLVETVLAAPKVFCDDTPMPVLDRRRRRTRTARFWSYAVDDRPWQGPAPPIVVYLFAEDRRGRHVHQHLTGFSGVLQVDGYAGYDELARPGGAITLACCLAHARRQFFEVYRKSKSSVAAEALRRIGTVYGIEERVRGLTAAERVIVRQAETKPILGEFKSWLMQRLADESAKSDLAKAIRYTLNHWEGLTVFLTDGRVEVDSNTVERTIRAIAVAGSLCTPSLSAWKHWKCVRVINATRATFSGDRSLDRRRGKLVGPDLVRRAWHNLHSMQNALCDQARTRWLVTPKAFAASLMVSHSPSFSAERYAWIPRTRRTEETRCAVQVLP